MYFPHPSEQLQRAFAARPYQGADPESAAFLFVGLDANYAEDIENHRIFTELLDYLSNGVEFWQRTGIHHPFLLPGYGKLDGAKYHRAFASIGFGPQHAPLVSFVELIHLPTYGRSKLVSADLKLAHLVWLNRIITTGTARHVFVPDGVARLARASGAFAWMPKVPHSEGRALSVWYRTARMTVYCHYHLSVYGHQERKKQEQQGEIRRLAGPA